MTSLDARGSLLILALVSAAASAFACGRLADEAAAPTQAFTLCHRTPEGAFVRLAIPPADIQIHLAHGDGRTGQLVPGDPGSRFSQDCAIRVMESVRIDFNDLKVNGQSFGSIQESGFTVAPLAGPWVALTTYGRPAPSLIFVRPAASPALDAEMEVTQSGELFAFVAVDFYSSVTRIPHAIEGQLGGWALFGIFGELSETHGAFVTVTNLNPAMLIDRLTIRLTNPATACCENPMGLDGIVLMR
jgi:hypothetical protein